MISLAAFQAKQFMLMRVTALMECKLSFLHKMSSLRQSEIKRKTNETDISVFINLDVMEFLRLIPGYHS